MSTNVAVGGTTDITVTTGNQLVFKTINTDSGSVETDNATDTLTLSGGEGIDTAGTAGTDTITISGEDASTSNKGIASFSSSNFDVASGAVSIKANGINDTHLDFGTGTNQISTDDLTEGSSNQYFTDARARASVSVGSEASASGDGGIAYNSSTGVLTYTPPTLAGLSGSIDNLSDVDITSAAPSNNQVLLFNTSSGKFVPGNVSSGAGYQSTSVLSDLTDVTMSATSEGQILVFDASAPTQFVNRNLSGAITLDGDGVTALAADTVNDTHIDFGTGTNQVNTDDLPEGSSNQYFTNARAQAVSINNLSEDATPELGGTLDILTHDIKSSSANVVISADANDKDIILKIKDSGGTLNQAAHFNTLTAKINSTDGDLSTEASVHEPVMDIPKGIRIGTTAAGLSSTGALTANNNAGDWATTGITITNGDRDQWPTLDLISYGGANPLKNSDFDHDGDGTADDGTTVFGGIFNTFPNSGITLKAAGGTESSPSALASGKRLGVLGFMGHDGDGFGGTGAIASASLTCESAETFSNSNARGVKLVFDVLPTGGSASDGNGSSDRRHQLTMTGDTVQIGNENHDNKFITMDSGAGELDFTDTVIKLGEVGSAPSTASDHGFIYAKDNSGTADIYVKDGAGNETLISPHNEQGEWEYYSVNKSTGKTVRINMEKMIRKLEQITGESFIENE